jgi:hypothetical protein
MLERRGFGFLALLIINPLVILLYQNCSLTPVTKSEVAEQISLTQKRAISSMGTPQKIEITGDSENEPQQPPTKPECLVKLQTCPVATIE